MNGRRVAKVSLALAIVVLIASVAGFIITLVLNAFFLDKYNAYGEVPIPGTGSVHLPAGDANISLHVLVAGGTNGVGLPVPPLSITFQPPEGVAQPDVAESIGSTTTVNNDAHVRVWNIRVHTEGTYQVTADGQVGGYINPRLAFGYQSSYGYLVGVFVALFVVALVDLVLSSIWLGRARRKPVPLGSATYSAPIYTTPAVAPTAYEPTGEGVRLERLKTLAALRDSGALTEAEFQAEKRRILDEL
ncbi:SHOCT domain-containing protein [Mycobacterium vicinigordonae]|uniref:SHOCT domain-containing protein n=1 Tax=Mycobacterium vicinigordonae TaxID=1719132 RepID=A0A7D6HY77_9MYCO|nr:SHOCT domain-containing protein [Mycobacterium vicinigordonae]QLL05614.1 SHOCT domain-containing protein [Mycobacterium vicinigordonae]